MKQVSIESPYLHIHGNDVNMFCNSIAKAVNNVLGYDGCKASYKKMHDGKIEISISIMSENEGEFIVECSAFKESEQGESDLTRQINDTLDRIKFLNNRKFDCKIYI